MSVNRPELRTYSDCGRVGAWLESGDHEFALIASDGESPSPYVLIQRKGDRNAISLGLKDGEPVLQVPNGDESKAPHVVKIADVLARLESREAAK